MERLSSDTGVGPSFNFAVRFRPKGHKGIVATAARELAQSCETLPQPCDCRQRPCTKALLREPDYRRSRRVAKVSILEGAGTGERVGAVGDVCRSEWALCRRAEASQRALAARRRVSKGKR